MKIGRHMANEEKVWRPGEAVRILRATDDKAHLREPTLGFYEQRFKQGLAVSSIGPEIREVGAIISNLFCGCVNFGVYASIQRRDTPRSKQVLQILKRAAAGIAEYNVEVTETLCGKILDCFSSGEPLQCDGRVEIVKAANVC